MPTRPAGAIPSDPIREPHDVLAAEEFAMPTAGGVVHGPRGFGPRSLLPGLVLAVLALILLSRRRR